MATDTTGFCDKGNHAACSGVLRAATGHRWWCACECHPEPTPPIDSPDAQRAVETFHAARNRRARR